MTSFRLGKGPVKKDARNFKMGAMLTGELPAIKDSVDHSNVVSKWPMFANDVYGDCTFAAMAHMLQLFGALEGQPLTFRDSTVVNAYLKLSPNDQGCIMLDVLNFWRKTGLSRQKALAFMQTDTKDRNHLKLSVQLFGTAFVGLALPLSAQDQVGKIWTVPDTGLKGKGKPSSWGGHAVNAVGYTDKEVFFVTWGAIQRASWEFVTTYMDEAYAVLPVTWQDAPKSSGIDFAALKTQLAALRK